MMAHKNTTDVEKRVEGVHELDAGIAKLAATEAGPSKMAATPQAGTGNSNSRYPAREAQSSTAAGLSSTSIRRKQISYVDSVIPTSSLLAESSSSVSESADSIRRQMQRVKEERERLERLEKIEQLNKQQEELEQRLASTLASEGEM
jgi:hypothetical protein